MIIWIITRAFLEGIILGGGIYLKLLTVVVKSSTTNVFSSSFITSYPISYFCIYVFVVKYTTINAATNGININNTGIKLLFISDIFKIVRCLQYINNINENIDKVPYKNTHCLFVNCKGVLTDENLEIFISKL